MINESKVHSPKPSDLWLKSDTEARLNLVEQVRNLDPKFHLVKVTRAMSNGDVFVELKEALPPHIRGTLLLDLEIELKAKIDASLVVWCEPLGDKSTLRNLRGIEIRTERVADPRK
jgi:hypothetical protein